MNAIVRTFRGPDPRAALDAVRSALGEEAIILKTREIGHLWGRREVEITAASPEAAKRPEKPERPERPSNRRESTGPDLESEVLALRRIVDELRNEIRGRGAEPRGADVASPLMAVVKRLVQRGAEQNVAEALAREAAQAATSRNERDILKALRDGLRRHISPALPPWQTKERSIIALVGPPGVGKTTTIAKIAARALLETHLRVALITVDTYRVGASDHIGKYGEIMGVPTHVARDAAGLREAVAASADAQLILIDTAGRSDPAALEAQSQLLRAVPEAEQHLVLAASTGGRELRAAVRRFKSREVRRLIFTKIDEADGPASVLSVSGDQPTCPVSCITDGQRVPDDVHAVTSPTLCELILGKEV